MAAWAWQAGLCYVLGLQPTYRGLRLMPSIPSHWEGVTVQRTFGETRYEIAVENPRHVCHGVRFIKVNGQAIQGNLLPLGRDGERVRVRAALGAG